MSNTWKKLLGYNITLVISVALTIALGNPVAKLPALGPLLSPYTGFWRNVPHRIQQRERLEWDTLTAPVEVIWDKNRIPHIFAKNQADLFQVQGFVHARDRLFQMDLSTRPASGGLSEWLGDKTKKIDRFFVSMGMRQAVEASYSEAMKDSEIRLALENYSLGVNRWIESLIPSEYPVEYKLIGVSPSHWEPRRTIELLKVMTFRLAGRSYDILLNQHVQKIGLEKTRTLFPFRNARDWFAGFELGLGYQSIDLPQSPPFVSSLKRKPEYLQPFATNGSNNWAVSSSHTKDAHTYLANDTHLGYSSPSIWYEQQLVANDEGINIYGAAFPGGPGVEIGFHKSFGWGVTNGTTDIADWFEVDFKDEQSLEYLWDGSWVKAEVLKETILVKNEAPMEVELIKTKAGLVMSREGKLGLAFQWLAGKPSNDYKAFFELMKSGSLEECQQALVHLLNPSQNVICADPSGVSIRHAGRVPIRQTGDGQLIKDGRVSSTGWRGYVPFESLPKSQNPNSGMVYSANAPVAAREYPYYLSWDFASPFRAMRIRDQLRNMIEEKRVSLEEFELLQTDNFEIEASHLLPLMLLGWNGENSSAELDKLKAWDFIANAGSIEASLYSYWVTHFFRTIFEKNLGLREGNIYPKPEVVIDLLRSRLSGKKHPADWVFGGRSLSDMLRRSFEAALSDLKKTHGSDPKGWVWGKVQVTRLDHLLKIPAFGKKMTDSGGSFNAINANAGEHGASWRQIVKIGPDFEAKTNYPGGQSGNPFDPDYHRFVDDWSKGGYRDVIFYESLEQAKKRGER